MTRTVWVLAGLALGACAHEAPWEPGTYTPTGPYARGLPTRLTFDPSADSSPFWLPDGSGVLYSFERRDRPDRDRCLGLLPAEGGTRRLQICNTSGPGADSTDLFGWPALSPGGRLAYFRMVRPAFRQAITFAGFDIGTLSAPQAGPLLDRLPGTFAAGLGLSATQTGWLSDSAFVYLAVSIPAPFVPAASLALVRTRLVADSAQYDILPNTDTATSVDVQPPDGFYYTVRGDTRVLYRVLPTDSTTVVHDFGAGRIPTAVQVSGLRLAAIILNQIWMVDLGTGTEQLLPAPGPAMGLALAPSGTRLAAVLNVGGNVDLWLYELQ